jgi:hypothetical protein
VQWRADFERDGRKAVRREHMMFPKPKRRLAFLWLREKEKASEAREEAAQWYSQWTVWAAVAALIVGIIGVVMWYRH